VKPWTIEWKLLAGVEIMKGCLTCVRPEATWTVFRRYRSEEARELAWDGFQRQRKKWETTYEIRRGHDDQR